MNKWLRIFWVAVFVLINNIAFAKKLNANSDSQPITQAGIAFLIVIACTIALITRSRIKNYKADKVETPTIKWWWYIWPLYRTPIYKNSNRSDHSNLSAQDRIASTKDHRAGGFSSFGGGFGGAGGRW